MSKCKKAKNPCKICLQSVTPKTGLQCQGACEAWAHYACLNYTPGRVVDIRKNQITVTCPCPDCKTSVPKEFQTNTPYTCNNIACPANHPPACDGPECQANTATKGKPIPVAPPGTLTQCGPDCQEYSGCRKYVASTVSANRLKEEKEKQIIEKTRIRQERIRMENMSKSLSRGSSGRAIADGGLLGPYADGGYNDECPPTEQECNVQELIGNIGQLSEQIHELMKHLKCAGNKDVCQNLSDKCAELSVALCWASRMYARGSSPDLGRTWDNGRTYSIRTTSSQDSHATGRGLHLQTHFRRPDPFNCRCSNKNRCTINDTNSCYCP